MWPVCILFMHKKYAMLETGLGVIRNKTVLNRSSMCPEGCVVMTLERKQSSAPCAHSCIVIAEILGES